jgi:hypothetical protein
MKSRRIKISLSYFPTVALLLYGGGGCATEPPDDSSETESQATDSPDVCAVLFSKAGHEGTRTVLKDDTAVRPSFTSPIPVKSYVIQPRCELTYYRGTSKFSFSESESSSDFNLNFNTDDALGCKCAGAAKPPIAYFYVGYYYYHNAVPLWDGAAIRATKTIYKVKPLFDDVVTFLDGDDNESVAGIYQAKKANADIKVTGKDGFIVAERSKTKSTCP